VIRGCGSSRGEGDTRYHYCQVHGASFAAASETGFFLSNLSKWLGI